MFIYHPDRNPDEAAKAKLERVQAAYGVLKSSGTITGVSWYESLGGSDRKFTGPLQISSIELERPDSLRDHVLGGNTYAGVRLLSNTITDYFVRIQRMGP